jgi:dihydrofolate reductase
MRKLKLQVQISVDGYICGPNDEMDWMTWNLDRKLIDYISTLTDSSDNILLGRKMAGGFINYWSGVVANPGSPEHAFGKKMIDTPKVVFTKTMTTTDWPNTTLATGDLAEEIVKLKNQPGKDIIMYGGASFDAAVIGAGLIDEMHLFVNPVAVGQGKAIFKGRTNLELVQALPFSCGIVVHVYKPKQ